MKLRSMILLAALTLIAGITYAGGVNSVPVAIDFDNEFALGDQYSARTADNDVEFIGCGARRSVGGFVFGFCQATDSDGNNVFCATFDPDVVDAIGEIGEFGFISFNWTEIAPNNLECNSVRWSKQSLYLPNFTVKGSN